MVLRALLICFSIFKCVTQTKSVDVYTIGALFHDDDDAHVETAFKCAVNHFNHFNTAIFFRTVIKHVPKQNSFIAHQIVCQMLEEEDDGIVALFGPQTSRVATVVESISTHLELPHVQTHRPSVIWPYRNANIYSINFHPNTEQLQKGLGKIVEGLDWKVYAILYENDEDIVDLQGVLKLTSISRTNTILRKLNPPDFRIVLKEVKQLGYANIIIHYNSKSIMNILQQAKELDMLGYLYNYFLTSLDAYTLDLAHLNDFANITTIRITESNDRYAYRFAQGCNIGKIIPTNNSEEIPNALVEFQPSLMWDATNFFMKAFSELHLTGKPDVGKVTCSGSTRGNHSFHLANYIKIRPIPNTITGPIEFSDDKRSTLRLHLVETIQGNAREIAVWDSAEPDRISMIRSEKEQQDLIDLYIKNTTFIVSSRIGEPYLMPKTQENSDEELEGNDALEGYAMDVIDSVAKMLNFSYKFVLTEGNKYGSYNKEKKSWDGLIKDILDRRAHLAICDLTITQERRSAVDFSLPFMTLGVSILYSKAKPQERDIFAFMNPLDPAVWMYILAAYVAVTFILYFLTRLAPGDWENPNPADPNPEELENIWDLKNSFWLTFGSTMSAGCDILPKGISSRMGISMWWFFIIIINNSYIANLSAFLTTSRLGPSIDNAESLAKQTKIKYGVLDGGSTQSFFKNSNYSTYQRMWVQMSQAKPSVFVKDNSEGVKRVSTTKNQLYAFLMESSSIEYVTERNCDLKQVGGRLDNKGYGIAMPVNAPYRGAINMAILKMQEDGTVRRLKTKWWKEERGGGACKKEPEASSSDMQLAMANIGGVFVVVFIGIAIAFLIALGEFLWNIHSVSVEERSTHAEILTNELKSFIHFWKEKKRTYSALKSRDSPSDVTHSKSTTPKSNGDSKIKQS